MRRSQRSDNKRGRSLGRSLVLVLGLGLTLAAAFGAAARTAVSQDAAPFPPGESSQTLEGLNVMIEMPAAFDPAQEHSMVVVLHGAGGSESGMARSLAFMTKDDYVIVAPKSKGQVWEQADIEAVQRITADLKKRLHIGERRLHGIGFSNGGWNLAPVVFDEGLRFQSATWVAAGYKGGKPPKHAKKELGVLAFAGGDDPNRSAAASTVPALEGKVRSAEVRIQPGIGHEWPTKLMPYYGWWAGVQEGRYTPGDCAVYEWAESPAAALADAAARKTGALVYWWSAEDGGSTAKDANAAEARRDKSRAFQNDALRDNLVQHFGVQLAAAQCDRASDPEGFAKTGLKTTPALVVYDSAGKVKAKIEDKPDPKTIASAFRSVAPDKSLPKD